MITKEQAAALAKEAGFWTTEPFKEGETATYCERLCNLAIQHYVETSIEELTGVPHTMTNCPHGVDDGACKECYVTEADARAIRSRNARTIARDGRDGVDGWNAALDRCRNRSKDMTTLPPLPNLKQAWRTYSPGQMTAYGQQCRDADTALLKQCLDALVPPENIDSDEFINQMGATITALRERLGEPK